VCFGPLVCSQEHLVQAERLESGTIVYPDVPELLVDVFHTGGVDGVL
jgi:hypothetical protein